jgi:Sec7-like guanine-nucleotide exchange factor
MEILKAYCDLLGLKGVEFDIALRKLLSKFLLPGEAQQI